MGGGGIKASPKKVSAVVNYPNPNTVTEVRRFVGLAAYYRRLVPNFSAIANPLFKLMKKNAPFIWDEACQTAFELLKQKLTSAPVLAYPNYRVSIHYSN